MHIIQQITNWIHLILKEIWCKPGKGILRLSIAKVTESGNNDFSTFETINYVMGDSKKYPYPTTSLQRIFVYKQVICQAKDKFWPDKKPVWSDKFFLPLET